MISMSFSAGSDLASSVTQVDIVGLMSRSIDRTPQLEKLNLRFISLILEFVAS